MFGYTKYKDIRLLLQLKFYLEPENIHKSITAQQRKTNQHSLM
jgi:hypothetical protein